MRLQSPTLEKLVNVPRKIGILGVTGKNGFGTLDRIRRLEGIESIVGIVRKEEDIETVYGRLRDCQEDSETHADTTPLISTDHSNLNDCQIIIDWCGMNLATYKKLHPDFEEEAKKRGIHLRDMLLEENLAISISNDLIVKQHAPNCSYLKQGNPCDTLAWVANKIGLNAFTSGTMMEYYRLTKLVSLEFPKLSMARSSGFYVGEHGEFAVPVKDSINVGGVPLDSVIYSIYGSDGIEKLDRIYTQVNDEAVWLRERTGETPSKGPSAVTCDVVKYLLNPQHGPVLGLGVYLPEKDIVSSRPVLFLREGMILIGYSYNTQTLVDLEKADKHLKDMCNYAEEIIKEKNLL